MSHHAYTEQILTRALGYLPEALDIPTPAMNFDGLKEMCDFNVHRVREEDRRAVGDQLRRAFHWAAARFPLTAYDIASGTCQPTISEFAIGHSPRKKELLSASAIRAPGVVLVAADWPLKTFHRLGSVIVHESMHQALYIRETTSSPVRYGSLGYSPWRQTLRAGRMVWHAFWTFSVQYSMISEALLEDRRILTDDPEICDYIATIQERITICRQSLELFKIVSKREQDHCTEATDLIAEISGALRKISGYEKAEREASRSAFRDYESWAVQFERENYGGSAA